MPSGSLDGVFDPGQDGLLKSLTLMGFPLHVIFNGPDLSVNRLA